MDELLGQKEPDPPDGASCEPQRTKRLTTALLGTGEETNCTLVLISSLV